MKSKLVFALSGALIAAMSVSIASAETVTPASPQGWNAANVRSGGTVAIDDTHPENGQGSLHLTTTADPSSKADFVNSWGVVSGRTLGNITALNYSFFRDAGGTAANYLAPAFRLSFFDQPTGKSGYLIFEPVYQSSGNQPVATGSWIDTNMLSGNFWMREFGGSGTIEKYDVTLADWSSGQQQAPNAYILNKDTFIYGIETGVGSGWNGTFSGAVDNVNISFGRDTVSANFEPNATATPAVPEPATWLMMLAGFGAVGFAMRSGMRRSNRKFDEKIKRITVGALA